MPHKSRDAYNAWRREHRANQSSRHAGARPAIVPPPPPVAANDGAPAPSTPQPQAMRSQVVAVVSDVHFDLHDARCWRAFRRWHTATRPARTVLAGDMVDLGMLSSYPQEAGAPLRAIEQIQCLVREVNPLATESARVVFLEGNHESRWVREVVGKHAVALEGSVGLTFREQCLAHGLDRRVEWVTEQPGVFGVGVGPFVIRHGHKQAGRFGGAVHLAANALTKGMGQSCVMGHHHRAQFVARTAFGRTAIAIANPCMTVEHHYAPGADWQRGFTVIETHGPHGEQATAYVVVMQPDGSFAHGGVVYTGEP